MNKKIFIIITVFSTVLYLFLAESLWDDRAGDIYNRKIYYEIGDPVNIIINESSALSYQSTSSSLKSFNINVTGQEITGVFDFLPAGNVNDNKSGQERDNLQVNTVLQGRIVSVQDKLVTVRGSKRIQINNKISSVEISGDIFLSNIVDNSVYSYMMLDPVIRVTTLLDNLNNVIGVNDLEQMVVNPDVTGDIVEQTVLSEQKKNELLLNYFNKILNVIF